MRFGYDINQLCGNEWVTACKEIINEINWNVHTVKLDYMYPAHRDYACDLAHNLGVTFTMNGHIIKHDVDYNYNENERRKRKYDYRSNYISGRDTFRGFD